MRWSKFSLGCSFAIDLTRSTKREPLAILNSVCGERNGAGGGMNWRAGFGAVAGDDGKFVGPGFEAGPGSGDFVAGADGSFELAAAEFGGGVGPAFERLRGIGRFFGEAFEREQVEGAAGDGDGFGTLRRAGVNFEGDAVGAGQAVEVEGHGGGEESELGDGAAGGGGGCGFFGDATQEKSSKSQA